jgi:hypothetical protein
MRQVLKAMNNIPRGTLCARFDCGHPFSDHEHDERFTHHGGACGHRVSETVPEGVDDCCAFIIPGAVDELPGVLTAS